MNKLWSICIPTYNRAENLKRNLEYIFKQINDKNRSLLEIVVSNNASKDHTDSVVSDFIARGLEIAYYVNDSNIGPDGNFLQCVQKAKGKYVLLLGDDDYLVLGSIDRILDCLQKDDYGAVYIARNMFNSSDNYLTVRKASKDSINICLCKDGNEYLRQVSYFITFMSGTIFQKVLLGDIEKYIKYNSTNLLQISFYIKAALECNRNLIINESLLTTASNDNGGYALAQVFCENFNTLLELFKGEGLEQRTIDVINNDMLLTFFPFWLGTIRFKNTRFKKENANSILLNRYSNNWRFWFFVNPIIKWPKQLGWCWWTFLRVLRKIGLI